MYEPEFWINCKSKNQRKRFIQGFLLKNVASIKRKSYNQLQASNPELRLLVLRFLQIYKFDIM